jgi:hypothetical protein
MLEFYNGKLTSAILSQLYVTSRLISNFLYREIKLTVTIQLKIVDIALIKHHTAQPTLIHLKKNH